jgi:hypothetical protein
MFFQPGLLSANSAASRRQSFEPNHIVRKDSFVKRFALLLIQFFVHVNQEKRCCYTMVDSATAASQNGFCSYKLSSHKKTNIMQIVTKILQFLFI